MSVTKLKKLCQRDRISSSSDRSHRRAGQNPRNLAANRRIKAICSFLGVGFGFPLWLVMQIPVYFYGIFVVIALFLVIKGVDLWRSANRADQGARGEEDTAQELTELQRQGWQIEYGLQLSAGGDVDIFCVSPQGRAYIIDVKSHRGEVLSNGKDLIRRVENVNRDFEKDFLKQTMQQAYKVKEQKGLSFVTPIVVFSQATVRVNQEKIRGVYVIEKAKLASLLRKL